MNKYNYVVMDMDGTLVDTKQTHLDIFKDYFSRNYTDFPIMQVMAQGMGGSMFSICKRSGMDDDKIAEMLNDLSEFYLSDECEKYYENLILVSGAIEVIKKLKENGLRVSLISNSLGAFVETIMKKNGVYHEFDEIISSGVTTVSKAESFKKIIADKNLEPNKILYLGDYEGDVAVSRACGIDCCILYSPISWTVSLDDLLSDPGPDYVIKHIEKFLNIAL